MDLRIGALSLKIYRGGLGSNAESGGITILTLIFGNSGGRRRRTRPSLKLIKSNVWLR
jgi:hypothetical protein